MLGCHAPNVSGSRTTRYLASPNTFSPRRLAAALEKHLKKTSESMITPPEPKLLRTLPPYFEPGARVSAGFQAHVPAGPSYQVLHAALTGDRARATARTRTVRISKQGRWQPAVVPAGELLLHRFSLSAAIEAARNLGRLQKIVPGSLPRLNTTQDRKGNWPKSSIE